MRGEVLRNVFVRLCLLVFLAHVTVRAQANDGLSSDGHTPGEQSHDFIVVGLGGFDVNDNETEWQFEVQARFQKKVWLFTPQVGAFLTTESGFYAYVGGLIDFFLGKRYVLSPGFAVGTYSQGDGKRLGGALEFRSSLEISYLLVNQARLGIQVGHLSNASIYDENPGTEFAIFNYSIPTDVFSR